MSLDKRICENRNTDECEKYDNDGIDAEGTNTHTGACKLDNGVCIINPNSNDKYDCISLSYDGLDQDENGDYYVGNDDRSLIIKSLNCERLKEGDTERGTFLCETCTGPEDENNFNPCPEGWECEEVTDGRGNTNKYCVDKFLGNKNSFVINDNICFPPFYGKHGSSLRIVDEANPDSPATGDINGTECAAPGNHMYFKNGSPMLPHLFPDLLRSDDTLREAYYECMRELDSLDGEAKEIKRLEYFDKDKRSGKLYELLMKYFNMEAIDYCEDIFTSNTVLIDPTNDASIINDPSLYYPSWIELRDNILNSKDEDGENNAENIFAFLSGDLTGTDSDTDITVDRTTNVVNNWDNQLCMMHRGVDDEASLQCNGVTEWNKELCDFKQHFWNDNIIS